MIKNLCIFLLLIFIIAGCSNMDKNYEISTTNHNNTTTNNQNNTNININKEDVSLVSITTEYNTTTIAENTFIDKEDLENKKLTDKLNNMTIEEKIGQLFILAFRKDEKGNPYTEINNNITDTIKNYNIGGIILFSENIVSKEQTKKFISDMQNVSKEILFIAVDEEGGRVSRLGKLYKDKIPTAKYIGSLNDYDYAFNIGKELGNRLKELGFNFNFAPVADINTNSSNIVIGDRSFGNNKDIVSKMVEAEVKGINTSKVFSAIKHFPGHGDTTNDTHFGTVNSSQTLDRLNDVEFVPFISGIEALCQGVLVSHIILNNLDEKEPAIFSSFLLKDILRNKLNFDGLIITDALDMQAITNNYTSDQVSIKAFKAGVTIQLMPENFKLAFQVLLDAYNNNEITLKEIDDSVLKILKAKSKLIEK